MKHEGEFRLSIIIFLIINLVLVRIVLPQKPFFNTIIRFNFLSLFINRNNALITGSGSDYGLS